MIRDSLPVGIVLERRELDHPWQSHSWHAVAVIPGAPPVEECRLLVEGSGWARYHAATLEVELFEKETEGYRFNLSSEVPKVFVVLRSDEDSEAEAVPFLATVDPYEWAGYLDGDEIVDAVPMPKDMIAWVDQFVAQHHVDKPFKKRKRVPHDPDRGGPRKAGRGGKAQRGQRMDHGPR